MASIEKYANVVNGVVDSVTYNPDREKIIDYAQIPIFDTGTETVIAYEQIEVGYHWGNVLPPWELIPDEVFAGFTKNSDGTFDPPAKIEQSPIPFLLQMSDFWSRFVDDDEFDSFDSRLAVALPRKDRQAFSTASSLWSDSALFEWGHGVLTLAVGENRANEIMAENRE